MAVKLGNKWITGLDGNRWGVTASCTSPTGLPRLRIRFNWAFYLLVGAGTVEDFQRHVVTVQHGADRVGVLRLRVIADETPRQQAHHER